MRHRSWPTPDACPQRVHGENACSAGRRSTAKSILGLLAMLSSTSDLPIKRDTSTPEGRNGGDVSGERRGPNSCTPFRSYNQS